MVVRSGVCTVSPRGPGRSRDSRNGRGASPDPLHECTRDTLSTIQDRKVLLPLSFFQHGITLLGYMSNL